MITTSTPFEEEFSSVDSDSKNSPRRGYCTSQGNMVFVEPGSDEFNNAVFYSQVSKENHEEARRMPDGFYDTPEARSEQLKQNPRDDVALFAPMQKNLDDIDEAVLNSRQKFVVSNNYKRLGSRSLLWPPPLDTSPNATSYGNLYNEEVDFQQRADMASRRNPAE